mmetsp:Transcript_25905/g.83913  ORF Transcript_25905/g.83913 Transcript_25905/m.83913 type:complete len:215 (-) Transcript_25905:1197-1841(-)
MARKGRVVDGLDGEGLELGRQDHWMILAEGVTVGITDAAAVHEEAIHGRRVAAQRVEHGGAVRVIHLGLDHRGQRQGECRGIGGHTHTNRDRRRNLAVVRGHEGGDRRGGVRGVDARKPRSPRQSIRRGNRTMLEDEVVLRQLEDPAGVNARLILAVEHPEEIPGIRTDDERERPKELRKPIDGPDNGPSLKAIRMRPPPLDVGRGLAEVATRT